EHSHFVRNMNSTLIKCEQVLILPSAGASTRRGNIGGASTTTSAGRRSTGNLSISLADGRKRFESAISCRHDRAMGAEQLDLFQSNDPWAGSSRVVDVVPAAEDLDDEALVAALPDAELA